MPGITVVASVLDQVSFLKFFRFYTKTSKNFSVFTSLFKALFFNHSSIILSFTTLLLFPLAFLLVSHVPSMNSTNVCEAYCMPWYIASCNEWRHLCQHLTRSFVGVSVVFCGMVRTPYLQYVAMSDC